jgi:hypothetical protein
MPDPEALCKDGCEGTPIVLTDGNAWVFRKPVVRVRRKRSDNGTGWQVAASLAGDNGSYGKLYDAFESLQEGDSVYGPLFGMAEYLLLLNYDLTPEQVDDLVQFAANDADEEGLRIFQEVLAVATGRGPKPSADGALSPATPPA